MTRQEQIQEMNEILQRDGAYLWNNADVRFLLREIDTLLERNRILREKLAEISNDALQHSSMWSHIQATAALKAEEHIA